MADDKDAASLRDRAWQGVADTIRSGGYRVGDRLPSERELADRLGVSRSTLRLALHDLERSGFVERRPGRGGGTFVTAPRVERDLGAFTGLADYIRRQGLEAGARILSVAVAPADARSAAALRIVPDALAVHITRVRLADGEPIALERSRFPAELFPDLADQALGGSLYDLLGDRYRRAPRHAVERIQPVAADARMAQLLEVAPGTPLLAVERTAYDKKGVPVEHADDLFRGDRTRVVVWTTQGYPQPQPQPQLPEPGTPESTESTETTGTTDTTAKPATPKTPATPARPETPETP